MSVNGCCLKSSIVPQLVEEEVAVTLLKKTFHEADTEVAFKAVTSISPKQPAGRDASVICVTCPFGWPIPATEAAEAHSAEVGMALEPVGTEPVRCNE